MKHLQFHCLRGAYMMAWHKLWDKEKQQANGEWWVWSYWTRRLPTVGVFLSQVLSRGEEIRCVCIFIEIARQEGSTENLLVIVTKRNLKFHTQCWCFFVFFSLVTFLYVLEMHAKHLLWRTNICIWPITNVCPSKEVPVMCDVLGLICLRFKQYIHICTLLIICILITSNITV